MAGATNGATRQSDVLVMQEQEVRLECLKLALGLPAIHGSHLLQAEQLATWVLTGALPPSRES